MLTKDRRQPFDQVDGCDMMLSFVFLQCTFIFLDTSYFLHIVSLISAGIISVTVIVVLPQLCPGGMNCTSWYYILPTCSEARAVTCVIPHLRLTTFADTAFFQISVLSCS